ncbi:SDR family oxidoreductase [Eikenella sp. S3360]|uniref:SDR family oxidoreductase n=1 Tax=Eikenella glucosivorans TaxID=2766967 RepID=A0ABS0N9W6_9NEIS|nr:SDR family oxidoreductase [Eikenella glucosivorans]MBH5329049.1 SDR family oxidoreductase [Eikenella glucosivorans]
MNYIQNKVIIITGASAGMGKAAAQQLAAQGGKVVLAARDEAKLRAAVAEIKANGGEAQYFVCDVSRAEQVQALADFALQTYGQIDVLVNNAGYMPGSFLVKNNTAEWNKTIDINIKGVLYGVGAVLGQMRKQGRGQIINVASVAAYETPTPGAVVYCATKHAVRALTDGLRAEEAMMKSPVRISCMSPGAIDTDLKHDVTDPDLREFVLKSYEEMPSLSPDDMAYGIVAAINTPDNIEVGEIVVRPTGG